MRNHVWGMEFGVGLLKRTRTFYYYSVFSLFFFFRWKRVVASGTTSDMIFKRIDVLLYKKNCKASYTEKFSILMWSTEVIGAPTQPRADTPTGREVHYF